MREIISFYRGHLIALLSGSSAVFAFSPYDYWFVLCAAIGIFYLSLQNISVRQAAWRGFFFGLGFFGAGVSWVYVSIHFFGGASVLLATLLTFLFVLALSAVFFSPWCAIYQWLTGIRCSHSTSILLFAACWVLGEWFRSWFCTGFPWLLGGYSLIDTPVAMWAPVTGIYGLSFLLVLTSATAVHWAKYPQQLSASFIMALCIVLIAMSWPLKQAGWTYPTGGSLTFSAVQGNIQQQIKWDAGYAEKIIETYGIMSRNIRDKDMVIWPENAIPVVYQDQPALINRLNDQANSHHYSLVFGIPWYENSRYFNGVVALGQGKGHYLKQKLVPFGEYVPFDTWLRGLIQFFNLPMSSFAAGAPNQTLITVNGYPVAVYVCYEAVYPEFAAEQARGSAFIITVSNDTWFGASAGPWQHFQMVRMRALETGRYLINNTNDSATSLVAPDGKIIDQIPAFHAGILNGTVQPMQGSTPFMRYASWPVLGLCFGLLIMGVFVRRKTL